MIRPPTAADDADLDALRRYGALSGPFAPAQAIAVLTGPAATDTNALLAVTARFADACDTRQAGDGSTWLMRDPERRWELAQLAAAGDLDAAIAWRRTLPSDGPTDDLLDALSGTGAFAPAALAAALTRRDAARPARAARGRDRPRGPDGAGPIPGRRDQGRDHPARRPQPRRGPPPARVLRPGGGARRARRVARRAAGHGPGVGAVHHRPARHGQVDAPRRGGSAGDGVRRCRDAGPWLAHRAPRLRPGRPGRPGPDRAHGGARAPAGRRARRPGRRAALGPARGVRLRRLERVVDQGRGTGAHAGPAGPDRRVRRRRLGPAAARDPRHARGAPEPRRDPSRAAVRVARRAGVVGRRADVAAGRRARRCARQRAGPRRAPHRAPRPRRRQRRPDARGPRRAAGELRRGPRDRPGQPAGPAARRPRRARGGTRRPRHGVEATRRRGRLPVPVPAVADRRPDPAHARPPGPRRAPHQRRGDRRGARAAAGDPARSRRGAAGVRGAREPPLARRARPGRAGLRQAPHRHALGAAAAAVQGPAREVRPHRPCRGRLVRPPARAVVRGRVRLPPAAAHAPRPPAAARRPPGAARARRQRDPRAAARGPDARPPAARRAHAAVPRRGRARPPTSRSTRRPPASSRGSSTGATGSRAPTSTTRRSRSRCSTRGPATRTSRGPSCGGPVAGPRPSGCSTRATGSAATTTSPSCRRRSPRSGSRCAPSSGSRRWWRRSGPMRRSSIGSSRSSCGRALGARRRGPRVRAPARRGRSGRRLEEQRRRRRGRGGVRDVGAAGG